MDKKYISGIRLSDMPPVGSYLNTLPVVRHLKGSGTLSFSKDITFFVGENGSGKSTLLEAIAVAYGFNAEGGTKNFAFSTNATHSELCDCLTLSKGGHPQDGFFLRAESFYNVATNIDELDREPSFAPPVINSYGGVSLHNQSHGESFLSLVKNRFGGNGLYILDEPEAALSPAGLLTLMACIGALIKNNSQFLIATHSPMLMTFPNAQILLLTEDGIASVPYKQTEHFRLTKQFLENPDRMLGYLLEEQEP